MSYHNPTSSLPHPWDVTDVRTQQDSSEESEGLRCSGIVLNSSSGTDPCPHEATSIKSLPAEILVEIFLHCPMVFPGNFQFDWPAEPRRWQVPSSLCQVSHLWREVALSLPLLWCSLSTGSEPFTPCPAFIELWLTRSRGLPLSLHFEPPGTIANGPKYYSKVSKLFNLFSDEMHRWRTISFVLDNDLARQFIDTVNSKVENLEELELVFQGFIGKKTTADVFSLLPFFPNLRKLLWSGDIPAESMHRIPFHQLTHIYMESFVYAEDAVACLVHCTIAVEIQCRWKKVAFTDAFSARKLPRTSRPHLRSLFLGGREDPALVLSKFTLPSLAYLSLQPIYSPKRNYGMLEDFFARSSCPLEEFILDDDSLDDSGINKYMTIPFLKLVPYIKITSFFKGVLHDVLKDSRNTPSVD